MANLLWLKRFHFNHLSIRARLMLASVGILVLGFGVLTFVAGSQIAAAARSDYETQMLNTVRLVARGVTPYVDRDFKVDDLSEEMAVTVAEYEEEIGGTINFISLDGGHDSPGRTSYRVMPEVETAMRNEIIVVEREDKNGETRLVTAAGLQSEFDRDDFIPVVVQLSVPLARLNDVILQRWLVLIAVFMVVSLLAVMAALLVSRSIIKPLYLLRESALRLSQGDLDHRVQITSKDEIGAVAVAFNEMATQVQSMLEEQHAFASNTSHELRTPLTTIRLRSEAMRYDENIDADIFKQYVVDIDEEAKRLGALVEDLTLLSRFDAGRAELGATEIDMGRFVGSIGRQMAQQAQARGIGFSFVGPDDIVPVYASLTHLTVVFRNVLENAMKYTPSGGTIEWLAVDSEQAVVSTIQDTGQGIDADTLPHLFERFYRADKAHSRNVPGTGLGLALVKSILDAYGGTITIDSAGLGKGTVVTIIWPHRPTEN